MLQTRGLCMTPGVRANGPSYMKPLPAPPTRPVEIKPTDEPPIVIIRTVATRQEIVAASKSAAAFGIRAGMTLTEARALCAKVKPFDEDPIRDVRALEALARWMTRFTPRVALPLPGTPGRGAGERGERLSESNGGSTPDAPRPSPQPSPRVRGEGTMPDGDCLYLDLTGCERVFGGLGNIVRDVIESLRRLNLDAGVAVAVAPTPGAAWAAASFDKVGTIVRAEELEDKLRALPVAGLRLDEELLAALHHLGLEKIGQVIDLPRAALPSRFGPTLLMRIDQALGRIDEPLVPIPYFTPIEARMDFDGLVDSLEVIHLVFKRLIAEVVTELTRRGSGARKVEISFLRAYAQTIDHTIALSRPSRDPGNLFNLIRCAIENLDGGECDEGFLGIRLHVTLAERIADEQVALLGQAQYEAEVELARLIERLSVRLGESALARPVLVESHIPERAFAFSTCHAPLPCVCVPESHRPLQLLRDPVEIQAMVTPSEDRDGRPVQFRLDRDVHVLRHAVGPERISGEWWRGHDKTRDYFDVEDEAGKRFWVFRVNETSKWFLHGTF